MTYLMTWESSLINPQIHRPPTDLKPLLAHDHVIVDIYAPYGGGNDPQSPAL